MLGVLGDEVFNGFDGMAGSHFPVNGAGLGFDVFAFQHFGHAKAMFNWGKIRFTGKGMLIVRQEPDLLESGNELKSLVDDQLMAEMRRVKGAAEKSNLHGVIVADVDSRRERLAKR